MSNEQLSPQEALRLQKAIDQVNESWKLTLHKIGNDVALRKWCVEQCTAKGMAFPSPAELLRFITAPLTEVLSGERLRNGKGYIEPTS